MSVQLETLHRETNGIATKPPRLSAATIIYTLKKPFESVRTVDIERLADGILICAWRVEHESNQHVDMGSIFCSRSADGGKSWSCPVVIAAADEEWSYANVVLFDEGDAIWAFVGRLPADAPHSELQKLACWKSSDSGRTWSPCHLRINYPNPTIVGGKIFKFQDRYHMPFHRNDHGSANKTDERSDRGHYPLVYKEKPIRLHGVLVSDDLTNWDLGGIVPQSGHEFLQEGFLAADQEKPHEMLLVMREGDWHVTINAASEEWTLISQGHCAFLSRSSDGERWSSAEPWPDIPNYNVKGCFLTDSKGRYITFHNDASNREDLFAKVKDRAKDWSLPVLVSNRPGWNCYAAAVEAAPDRIIFVYEHDKREIVFQELLLQ